MATRRSARKRGEYEVGEGEDCLGLAVRVAA